MAIRLSIGCVFAAVLPLAVWAAEPAAPAAAATPAAPLSLVAVSTTKPKISDEACQMRLSGWVDLDFVVMPDGKVANVTVSGSEPKGAFDAAAAASVAQWTYEPQQAPVKMHQRLPMSFADCQPEQMRVVVPSSAAAATESQTDCPAIATEAKGLAERFERAESARSVLAEGAQVYSAPSPHCYVIGKKLKPASRLTALAEYKTFSLVAGPKGGEDTAVWVWSNQLKDLDP